MALTLKKAVECIEKGIAQRQLFATNVATRAAYQFVFGKGGVPIVEDGRIIGAVGVSGAVPAEHDHAIAQAAAGYPPAAKSH